MSKKLSFRGILDMGVQQKIKLSTIKGKRGYKITKFQVLSETPGNIAHVEFVAKIYAKAQTAFPATVDFSESDLLAALYYQDHTNTGTGDSVTVIFDNNVFNQDIFIYCEDAGGSTAKCNYYIELETVELTELESTQLTLKSLRQIASR
jgi:hypothetical protein